MDIAGRALRRSIMTGATLALVAGGVTGIATASGAQAAQAATSATNSVSATNAVLASWQVDSSGLTESQCITRSTAVDPSGVNSLCVQDGSTWTLYLWR